MEDECPDFNYKIILIGDSKVGKTSITNRYVNDLFNQNQESSRAVQVQRKTINIETTDKWASLHIWDTLGQEKFKAVAPLFFRKAVGAFLVFDCTSRKSFENISSWFSEITNHVDTRVIIMLIGKLLTLINK